MSFTLRGITMIAVAGTLLSTGVTNTLTPSSPRTISLMRSRAVGPPAPGSMQSKFAADQIEHFLSDDGIAYIRPGLKITIASISDVAPGKKPVVELTLTDNFDQPLDRLGKVTPGVISPSFILAVYDGDKRMYKSYTTRTQTTPPTSPRPGVSAVQAGTDSGGTWVDLSVGRAKYTFKTAIPADADMSKTHTLGVYGTRNLTDIIGKNYYYNVTQQFRPDGGTVTEKWDKVTTAACNQCHGELSAHGGSRREAALCVLCHSDQTTDPDTGNTVAMNVMIHKIHRGENLPSVKAGKPYQIIGNAQSLHDFSEVAFPQDVRNCKTCHEFGNQTQKDVWYTKPSRAACGSCHDDINWVTGENHAGKAQVDDAACASCHVPDSGQEFDASIIGGHMIPEKSKQLKGLTAKIVSVADLAPGKKATVVYQFKNKDGSAVDGSKLNAFAPMIAGATKSYTTMIRESAAARATFDSTTGYTTFTFNAPVPADAKGTWTVSGDFYRNSTIKRADGGADITLREAAMNPIQHVAIDGAVSARRTVVQTVKCNGCHETLALHGGQRLTTEECVMCHNPLANDSARRPANAGQPESISFQRMIHRIHSGAELTQDFTIYGFGNTANNFNKVEFPQDRRNCTACHVGNSQLLPIAESDPVNTLRDYFSPQGPGTAACLGCHDLKDNAAHAFLNTANFAGQPAEACATCHGVGKDWAVDKMHAH